MVTNSLTAARTAAQTLLANAGLHAFAVVPERVTAPFIYVAPGDPYLSWDGMPFGVSQIHLNIGCVVGVGVNDVTATALDDLLLQVLRVFEPGDGVDTGFTVQPPGQPGQISVNGQSHLGVVVEVTTEIRRSA